MMNGRTKLRSSPTLSFVCVNFVCVNPPPLRGLNVEAKATDRDTDTQHIHTHTPAHTVTEEEEKEKAEREHYKKETWLDSDVKPKPLQALRGKPVQAHFL